jgi:hypothetical protein
METIEEIEVVKQKYEMDAEVCENIPTLDVWSLYQTKGGYSSIDWQVLASPPTWNPGKFYRRNPQADTIIEYHRGSDEDKKHWQMKGHDARCEWVDIEKPVWREDNLCRRKPGIIVTVNGETFFLNLPMNKAPEDGDIYWTYTTFLEVTSTFWTGSAWDYEMLILNKAFRTEEDCMKVIEVLRKMQALPTRT